MTVVAMVHRTPMAPSLARLDGGASGSVVVGQRIQPWRMADDGWRSRRSGNVKTNSWQKTLEEEAQRSRKMQCGEDR
jgi:hypothetical protein